MKKKLFVLLFLFGIKGYAQDKDVSTLSRISSLFSVQLSADYAIKENKLVYQNNIFVPIDAKYQDYFLTFELYTPLIRWQRTFLPLEKTIKNNKVNINNSTYANYSYQKLDLLGLINLQDFIYKKWRKDKKWLSTFALLSPFYKQSIINTEKFYQKSKSFTVFVGFTYEQKDELIASDFKFNNINYVGGKYSMNMVLYGLKINEFYNSLQSYFIHKSSISLNPDKDKKFVFVPTPAISYYKFESKIGYKDANNIDLGSTKYKGTGFTAGIGAIFMYRVPSLTFYTNFIYMPWHNEGFQDSNGNEIYRDFNNDYSFNIGIVCNPLFFLNKKSRK